MDLRKLKTLIDLVAESGIVELEITEGEDKVRILKNFQSTNPPAHSYPSPSTPARRSDLPTEVESAAINPTAQENPLKAPMVGTFYRSSSPGAVPFVEVGEQVKEGDPLCIIEAMKLLNEIEADRTGIIRKILVKNGEPVEYGQPLFVID